MSVTLDRMAGGTQRMTARTRELVTLKNLHIAGVAVLGVVCLYLMAHMVYAWRSAQNQDASALAQATATMEAAKKSAQPLAGLDDKLKQASVDSDDFYKRRLPYAYSEFLGEMGALAKKTNVKLGRVQYTPVPALEGGIGPLTEVRMDASLSGDYRPLMMFINGLERDKMFFLIRGVALVGQQSGSVGVRLALTTYLRAPVGDEVVDKSVATSSAEGDETADAAGAPRGGAPR